MTARYLLAAAAVIPVDGEPWTPQEVRDHLALLADQLEPDDVTGQQLRERLPLTGPHVAEAVGRILFRAEVPTSDYSRCVQVAQILGDCANRLDVAEDFARAELLRTYAHAVSTAGNAL